MFFMSRLTRILKNSRELRVDAKMAAYYGLLEIYCADDVDDIVARERNLILIGVFNILLTFLAITYTLCVIELQVTWPWKKLTTLNLEKQIMVSPWYDQVKEEWPAYAGIDLSDRDFDDLRARNAVMPNARFHRSELRGADFSSAILKDADFCDAELAGAVFHYADLRGVDFRKARGLSSSSLDNATCDYKTRLPPALVPLPDSKWSPKCHAASQKTWPPKKSCQQMPDPAR